MTIPPKQPRPQTADLTTEDEWHGLHEALHKVRSTSATVTIDKQALAHLLIDHARAQGRRTKL